MPSNTSHRWIEMQPFGSDTVRIELTRYGRLWHGQAARMVNRNRFDINPLATAVGMDFENVRHQVLQTVRRSLKH